MSAMERNRRAFLRMMLGVSAAPLLTACAAKPTGAGKGRSISDIERVPPLPDDLANWQPMGSAGSDLASLLGALPRSRWATAGPIPARLNGMGQTNIEHITVHHEGSSAVYFDDEGQVRQRLDAIRRAHLSRAFGDIGYHFIVDRAGRVWEGRSLVYQGAHVKDHNYHNLGIMALGNFDEQAPTDAQLRRLIAVVRTARAACGVPLNRVHTHQELKPTRCPGHSLQRYMVNVRHNGTLA
jgi:hypothetical protein